MPVIAGIIDIIHGIAGLLVVLLVILVSQPLRDFFGSPEWYSYLFLLAVIIAAMLGIIGGISTLNRKNWPLASAGSLASLFLTAWSLEYWINLDSYGFGVQTLYGFAWFPAMFSLVMIVLSRKQFR